MKKNLILLSFLLMSTLLSGCNNEPKKNRVVIYTAAERERIDYLEDELKTKFPEYIIDIQYWDTGKLGSILQAEKTGTKCDIFYDIEAANASLLSELDIFADLSSYDKSIYEDSILEMTSDYNNFVVNGKAYVALLINKNVLGDLPVPRTYEELIDPMYKGMIQMPNPKTSGTGYTYYNGLVSEMGEEKALNYFTQLNDNVAFVTAGSSPFKAVDRGEIGIGMGILWQAVEFANENEDFEVVFLNKQSAYTLYAMGMIKGKETKEAVSTVFNYLYNELNQEQVIRFNPDKIYKNQKESLIENYPLVNQDFTEIQMQNLFSSTYKQELLDKWKF